MPKRSEREDILSELEGVIKYLASDTSLLVEREENDFPGNLQDDLLLYYSTIKESRYLIPRTYKVGKPSLAIFLRDYTDRQFRQEVRMDRGTFEKLCDKLSSHAVFQNQSRNQQTEVWIQCLVTFRRFGGYGNSNSLGINGRTYGFSEGAVVKFKDRVTTALLDLGKEVILWPDANERKQIRKRFKLNYGINGAVGIIDGTPVIFSQKPAVDGETFWSRKAVYCMNLQLVCDDQGLIRDFFTGCPGSMYDNKVFERMSLFKDHATYFSEGEFLLADSGYALTTFCLVPYRHPQAQFKHNQDFNELFSSARVKIEHVNGILKSRWSSLKGLPTQIKKESDLLVVNKHIAACIVLYNYLRLNNDAWIVHEDELEQEDAVEAQPVEAASGAMTANREDAGKLLRLKVQNECLEWHYRRTGRLV